MTAQSVGVDDAPGLLRSPREVRVLSDVCWGAGTHPEGRDRLDLYLPVDADGAPVLFWIHGGGLFMGEKSAAVNVGLAFARAGYVVACTNHRLSPEVAHPGHVRDVAAAFAWVVIQKDRLTGRARTASFHLPPPIVALIQQGKELGEELTVRRFVRYAIGESGE